MRVLIYDESEAAVAKRDALNAERHHAVLRNPQFFNPAQFDKHCELVITDHVHILQAYAAVGIATEALSLPDEPETSKDAPPDDSQTDGVEALESMTVAQLKELAAERGIDLQGVTKKADIIEAIAAE